jgi:hypothetical protein
VRAAGTRLPVTALLQQKRMEVLSTDSVVVSPVSEHEQQTCFACVKTKAPDPQGTYCFMRDLSRI